MNKRFFQSMFSNATSGQVYRFQGTIPAGTSSAEHVTVLYTQAAGSGYDTTVVELPDHQAIVLYTSAPEDTLSSADFELITNLIPDPLPEPEPEVEGNVEVSGDTVPE
jgi:hypothetical protein